MSEILRFLEEESGVRARESRPRPRGSRGENTEVTNINEVRAVAGATANSLQHDWGDPGHDQVEQPLCRGGNRDGVASEPVRRDLADVDPADRAPTELESRRKEVHHHEGCGTSRRNGLACLRGVESHEKAEVEHEDAHRIARPDERPPTAESVREESDKDCT